MSATPTPAPTLTEDQAAQLAAKFVRSLSEPDVIDRYLASLGATIWSRAYDIQSEAGLAEAREAIVRLVAGLSEATESAWASEA